MGSVAPKKRDAKYVRQMLQEITRLAKGVDGEDPDIRLIADLIDDALLESGSRRLILLSLAAFITESLGGSVPHPDRWIPPSL